MARSVVMVLVATMLMVAAACTSSSVAIKPSPPPVAGSAGDGVVFGGIAPCAGLVPSLTPNLPTYAAGTVTVFAGKLIQPKSGPPLFPTTIVAKETVKANELYRFVLRPGDYVLQGQFPPPSNVLPFRSVTVVSGVTIEADIPNMCM